MSWLLLPFVPTWALPHGGPQSQGLPLPPQWVPPWDEDRDGATLCPQTDLASLALVSWRIDEVPSPPLEEMLLYGFSFWTVIKNNNGGNESCFFMSTLFIWVVYSTAEGCSKPGLIWSGFSSETQREESPLAWWTRCCMWQHPCRRGWFARLASKLGVSTALHHHPARSDSHILLAPCCVGLRALIWHLLFWV